MSQLNLKYIVPASTFKNDLVYLLSFTSATDSFTNTFQTIFLKYTLDNNNIKAYTINKHIHILSEHTQVNLFAINTSSSTITLLYTGNMNGKKYNVELYNINQNISLTYNSTSIFEECFNINYNTKQFTQKNICILHFEPIKNYTKINLNTYKNFNMFYSPYSNIWLLNNNNNNKINLLTHIQPLDTYNYYTIANPSQSIILPIHTYKNNTITQHIINNGLQNNGFVCHKRKYDDKSIYAPFDGFIFNVTKSNGFVIVQMVNQYMIKTERNYLPVLYGNYMNHTTGTGNWDGSLDLYKVDTSIQPQHNKKLLITLFIYGSVLHNIKKGWVEKGTLLTLSNTSTIIVLTNYKLLNTKYNYFLYPLHTISHIY